MQLQNVNLAANNEFAKLSAIDLLLLSQELDSIFLEYRDSLNLERKVRFGIELEYEGTERKKFADFLKKQNLNWKSVDDETLVSGGEAVSPRLLDERKTWENLQTICQYLKANKADTRHNAGLHIHVGAHILGENIDAWRKFAKIYTIYERVLIRFGFGDKINARSTLFSYAKPVGLSFLGTIHDLDQNRSLMASRAFYKKIYDIKKNAINLRSLDFLKAIVNMNTIEFRNFNSTTEETIIQNDINAVSHMVLAAASNNLDEDFLNYKLKQLEQQCLSERAYLEQCSQILLRDMAELVDLIFDNNQDKIYFMRQYVRNFETCEDREVKVARELVRK